MSDLLKAFYLAYAAWLDDGADVNDSFTRDTGLCYCLLGYCGDLSPDERDGYERELTAQFTDVGLSKNFPFNKDETDYWKASAEDSHYLNPKRIAWVRNQVEKIKAES